MNLIYIKYGSFFNKNNKKIQQTKIGLEKKSVKDVTRAFKKGMTHLGPDIKMVELNKYRSEYNLEHPFLA